MLLTPPLFPSVLVSSRSTKLSWLRLWPLLFYNAFLQTVTSIAIRFGRSNHSVISSFVDLKWHRVDFWKIISIDFLFRTETVPPLCPTIIHNPPLNSHIIISHIPQTFSHGSGRSRQGQMNNFCNGDLFWKALTKNVIMPLVVQDQKTLMLAFSLKEMTVQLVIEFGGLVGPNVNSIFKPAMSFWWSKIDFGGRLKGQRTCDCLWTSGWGVVLLQHPHYLLCPHD